MSAETKARILLIDNDEDLLRALSLRLEDAGYVCETANSGAQGLGAFASGAPDLVITDLNMPGGDGITVLRKIREGSAVPILVMTGFSKSYRDQLAQMEHISCLRKPFDTEVLLDLVETELTLAPTREETVRPAG